MTRPYRLLLVVGARPNFMKIAPLVRALAPHAGVIEWKLVHTGQHYDAAMSDVFFGQLGIPRPDVDLGVGSDTHARQTAAIMTAFEPVLVERQPDMVVVVGDVNSTLACALVAKKLGAQVAHVEAGLRSFDRQMPEEINRILTDQLSDLLFVTEQAGLDNLRREGIAAEKTFLVGNVMIDTLLAHRDAARALDVPRRMGLEPQQFGVLTLHRPTNVDNLLVLEGLFAAIGRIAQEVRLVFPVHPRTRPTLSQSPTIQRLVDKGRVRVVDPLGYLEFLGLMAESVVVLTDSGGIQEETTVLGIPCLTLRDNTERPVTISEGTNRLVGTDPARILAGWQDVLAETRQTRIPKHWDGQAAKRIIEILLTHAAAPFSTRHCRPGEQMTLTSMLPAMEPLAQTEAASRRAHATDRRGPPVCVMHVLHALHPGGMEFGVVKLVNGLDRARVRSSICSTAPVVGNMKPFVSPEVPIFELRRRNGNDPKLVWDLYRLFRRERPHVVHTHAWGTLIEGLMAARLAGIPFVVHGEHGTLQLRGYQARLQRWVWGQTTQVLSVSQKLAEKMTAGTGFPAHRIRTIQNGVDFSKFSPGLREPAREAFGLGAGVLAIGTAGRLVPVKHQENLIDALAIVRDRGVEFTAFIAGEGPLRKMLETRIAERGLNGHVRLLGHRSDIERVFAALDIFVLPSRSEGMSNTILEAMASGVPVVATNVGDAPELVDHGRTGLLAPREDAVALAGALAELAVDAVHRRQMGAAARVKAVTQFSLDRMLRAYEALYLDLVSVRAGHQLGG